MANYNPHTPDIVGQEWVPIIGAPYQPDITQERGYTFTVSKNTGVAPIVARVGRFVVANVPSGVITSQVPFMSLYEKGSETTGPIMSAIMECDGATSGGPDGAFFGTLSGAAALQNPSDDSGYSFTLGSAPINGTLDLSFSSATLPPVIGRIHNVSLLYSADGTGLEQATAPNTMWISIRYRSTDFYYSTGALVTGQSQLGDLNQIQRISFGEVNPNWSDATFTATNDRYPWTTSRLALFATGSGDPMRVRFQWSSPTLDTDLQLQYAALQITYSPFENRLMYGGTHIGMNQYATALSLTPPTYGPGADQFKNRVILRTGSSQATGTGLELQPGEYTVTMHLADYGDANNPIFGINAAAATNTRPTINASRELYDIPSITGKEIERAFTTSDTMRVETTHLIPAIGIGVTGSAGPAVGEDVYSGCHGYFGPQAGEIVSIAVPLQNFYSDNKDGALPYPWIRFYARQVNGDVSATAGINFTVTTPAFGSVSITSAELDALPEIFDGWREVTLRFPDGSVPIWDSDTVTQRTITWSGNTAALNLGVAFQVLGDGSVFPYTNARYQGLLGAGSNATFPLTASAAGSYTFLFSTDPPTITGIGVTTQSVALTGIGTECGITPQCIPTTVACNYVTWPLPHNQAIITDTFDRSVSNGWGNATSGQAWSTVGGVAGDYSVTNSAGVHSISAANSSRATVIGPSTTRDFDITVNATIRPASGGIGGASSSTAILGRWVDASNYYEFRVEWTTSSGSRDTLLTIRRVLAGVETVISSTTAIPFMDVTTGNFIRMRAAAQGSTLMFKAWDTSASESEPALWQLTVTDSSFTQGQVGVRSFVYAGSTSATPIQFSYDSFSVRPTEWNFGYYELQRMDDDTPWQTIMTATSPSVTGFCDFEARIGMRSDYRIRQRNVYDFYGPWSTTVSSTLPSPVTGTGADGYSLLVFTSNTNQVNGQTLAYTEVWESNPTHEMTYFEGEGMVQFQRMYRRDFQVGFHSLERGGVQFTRTLLVQNAAVPAPILENAFQSLRDMAWDDLPYVCVRTNVGDRWYAAVEVPSGTISRNRRLQLVQVKVTEVTGEPYAVDPEGVPRAV